LENEYFTRYFIVYVKLCVHSSIQFFVNYSIFHYATLITFYAKYCEESIYVKKIRVILFKKTKLIFT